MKTKVRTLKKLYFSDSNIIQPNEYVEIDNKLLQKFLKWKAVELVEKVEEIEKKQQKETKQEYPQSFDINSIVDCMHSIKSKSNLIEYGESLCVEGLNMDMNMETMKKTILESLEKSEESEQ